MKKIFLIILISLTLMPIVSKAQEYTLLEPLPCIEGTGNKCDDGVIEKINLDTYIGYIFKFSIALAAFLAVIMLIWGGVETMGSEVPFIKSNGKKKIWDAITGLLMVLASYLILATIDPRLVEINTKIEPIKIKQEDLDAVRGFQNTLASDLKNLSAENQLKFREIDDKRAKLEAERRDLDARYERGEVGDIEYEAHTEVINQDLANINANKKVILAENIGLVRFTEAYRMVGDQKNLDDSERRLFDSYRTDQIKNELRDGKYPTNSPNEIQNLYNTRINEILQSDPVAAQTLARQRDFYISQIKEELQFEYRTREGISGKEYLNSELKKYEGNLNNTEKIAASGISAEQYNKITQTRIDILKKKLETRN